jgi:GAF domain-containing protein
VSADRPAELAAVAERLRSEESVPGILGVTARGLVDAFGARGCTISRVIGDLLVDLIQHRSAGDQAETLGHGYLISDYPLTREVIEQRRPETVFLGDPNADEREAALLRTLGFASLLMLPIEAGGEAWGLVEVYGDAGRRFDEQDVEVVAGLVQEAGERLEQLEQRA